ncbi:MAG: ATP-dependent sacrificial sulfur transferase LarE [candidate division NC10 bacterium]|nr:ATP-dependent sacrificial sulfur transferase LarE [candidate division NC10 bacterium]
MQTVATETLEKLLALRGILARMGKVLIAFSGGVDSTFLLKVAHEVLDGNVLAVTATSKTYPEEEVTFATKVAAEMGVSHLLIETKELENEVFVNNPPNRCFTCKEELFGTLRGIARERGIPHVLDGTNYDDRLDFRPGRQAAKQIGIRSPLLEAKLTKQEIRLLSKEMGLPTWDKPSMACFASRIPYGEGITLEKLAQVEMAERYIKSLGYRTVRVRHHGEIARIEVPPEDFPSLLDVRERLLGTFKSFGFTYVVLDLAGFRSGSMNEALSRRSREALGGPLVGKAEKEAA